MPNILTTLVDDICTRYGDREAFSAPDSKGNWEMTTCTEFRDRSRALAASLLLHGMRVADKVAIFSPNRPQTLVTDFAAYALRMAPISIYATSSSEQVEYIVRDCGARILFVGDERQLQIGLEVAERCPEIELIVVNDPDWTGEETASVKRIATLIAKGENALPEMLPEIDRRTADALPEDIATIVYTSGTTGEPKGAVLPHSCFNDQIKCHVSLLTELTENDTSLCFLPLCHIFEKAWTYFCLYRGIRVSINIDPRAIQQTIVERRPTCMCSVPRFWEKVYTAIQGKLASMHGLRKWILNQAIKTGRERNLKYVREGQPVPLLLRWKYAFFYHRVLRPVQKIIGVENGNMFPTAGAPLSPAITEFFRAIGIPIKIGYGLSETTATVSCFPEVGYQIGSVGVPIPIIKVRIGADNEIQIKGPTVMSEYYRKPEATAEAFTADGWFRTGDAGRLDPDTGAIYLTERIKDLFKTSNGKYIAPQAIESRLGEDPYIEQVALIGDQRKFVSALIVPNYEALRKYAQANGIDYFSTDDLVKNTRIHDMLAHRIESLQHGFASFERIKRFTLLPEEFTMDRGELTNTLKIKRSVINRLYAKQIDAMYADL